MNVPRAAEEKIDPQGSTRFCNGILNFQTHMIARLDRFERPPWCQLSIDKPIDALCDVLYHYSNTVKRELLRLDPSSGLPIYLQLVDQIKHAVEICALTPGDQLPSVRTLAHELVISPNTVVKVYTELASEGVVELRQGAGVFIVDQEREPRSIVSLRDAKLEVHGVIARFRGRGLSDGEIRRLFEAELLAADEPVTKRGRRI
jgi:GntR family transcriptional regulator